MPAERPLKWLLFMLFVMAGRYARKVGVRLAVGGCPDLRKRTSVVGAAVAQVMEPSAGVLDVGNDGDGHHLPYR